MNETRELAAFLAHLTFDDLDDTVVETATSCVLDTVGVALNASTRPWSAIVADMVRDTSAVHGATVWGAARGTIPAQFAALANATAAHGIEMDDRVQGILLHPGATVVPSALAMGEARGISGRELLVAVVAGYELGVRVGEAITLREGLHGSGHKAVWSAVGAAGRAARLDATAMLDALGIAASLAAGIWEFSHDPRGTMVKRLHAGAAAQSGVTAAELASRGFCGPATALEGLHGYLATYGVTANPAALTADLGQSFRILRREIKPYAAWGGAHAAIDAIAEISREHAIDVADVVAVNVRGSRLLLDKHDLVHPTSIMAAQYSLPFLTAIALTHGAAAFVDPDTIWTPATVDNPQLHALADRVTLGIDPHFDAIHVREGGYGGVHVEVVTGDGLHRTATVEVSSTSPRPSSPEDVETKFRRLAGPTLGEPATSALIATIRDLAAVDDVTELGARLAHAPGASRGVRLGSA